MVIGLCLAGCGGDGTDAGGGSTRSPVDVAEDRDASAAEIVAVGYPFDADAVDEGSRLVLYRVAGETGDVEQTAWRLSRADGETVAEGKGGSTVAGLGDGFWLGDDVVVGADGRIEAPSIVSEPLAPRPGDLAVRDFEGVRALRPDPLTRFAPRPAPRGFGQGWTIDPEGRQWYQQVEPERVLVGAGPDWERVRAVPVGPAQRLLGFGITAVGDHVVLPVVRSAAGEHVRIDAVAVRRADAPAETAWELLRAGPLASGPRDFGPRTFALGHWYYVFSDLQRPPYVLDVRSGRWRDLSLPTDEPGWTLEPGRDGLYAFPPFRGDETSTDTWFSADLGGTWEQLGR